jgi:hypothetical protein
VCGDTGPAQQPLDGCALAVLPSRACVGRQKAHRDTMMKTLATNALAPPAEPLRSARRVNRMQQAWCAPLAGAERRAAARRRATSAEKREQTQVCFTRGVASLTQRCVAGRRRSQPLPASKTLALRQPRTRCARAGSRSAARRRRAGRPLRGWRSQVSRELRRRTHIA